MGFRGNDTSLEFGMTKENLNRKKNAFLCAHVRMECTSNMQYHRYDRSLVYISVLDTNDLNHGSVHSQ